MIMVVYIRYSIVICFSVHYDILGIHNDFRDGWFFICLRVYKDFCLEYRDLDGDKLGGYYNNEYNVILINSSNEIKIKISHLLSCIFSALMLMQSPVMLHLLYFLLHRKLLC